ncbi:uncharacterized protein LOC125178464 [Hyalella azteca]|uniref:Uncharacterized protein LOC125178464 n=1 Tax=Hyalella azteca TaxID=294128 RepID=A0A979FNV9_HYAAZ|nr:uncharacterized protein LOC125178464 [Hyalella azteca]
MNFSDINAEETRSDDPRLIDLIRKHYLIPASTEPYALRGLMDPSDGQSKVVDKLFKQKTHGVFVECGAYDGEFLSNTIFLERFRAWTGLLIEPEPSNFAALKKRHRKALISNSCLSSKPHPSEFILRQEHFLSETLDVKNISYDREIFGTGDVSYKIVRRVIGFRDINSEETRSDDPRLIDLIRKLYLIPASAEPYALSGQMYLSDGQSKVVDKLFKQKTHGVFVECGAYDGEFLSNTLFLERFRAWTGLLMEPEPSNFEALKRRRRKALISNSCLSNKPHPSEFILRQERYLSETLDVTNISYDRQTFGTGLTGDVSYKIVQCFPFYTFLLATNITAIDYFSLDVEGQELNVLKTIPWHQVDIKVISVEYQHVEGGKAAVNAHMEAVGYVVHEEVTDPSGNPSDVVYVRRDLVDRFGLA